MPWNKDDEGGGQGPWGQGPKQNPRNQNNWGGNGGGRGPGGGNLPPDLDDLVRRGKDRFKQALPGGGGGIGSWLLPIALFGAFVLFNSFHQVQPDEKGVVMRFGTWNRTVEPGLRFAIWPFELMERPRTSKVNQIDLGTATDSSMLTADKNIINVPFSVFWQISDAKDYLYNSAEPESVIETVSQSAMREVVGQTNALPLLTTSKDVVAAQVKEITQRLLDEYKTGVIVTSVNLGDVQPPAEVRNAFDEVVRAGQNKEQLINQAEQYFNQETRLAAGKAAKLIEDANGYKSRVVAEAEGEAARFISIYEQYKDAKVVTRERLFLEMMEQVLAKTNKIVIEGGQGGSGVVPYLPLPSMQKPAGQN
jgi:membrane protease subunit HflK